MSDSRTILPAPKLLNLLGVRADENAIILAASTSSRVALCPLCGKRSARVHSRYARTLADLPWQGIPVTVRLRVRRFFCDRTTVAGPSDSRAGSRTSPLPSEVKRVLAF